MHERTEYPAGVPCWVDTVQPGPEAAAAFYGGLFGWDDSSDRTQPRHAGALPGGPAARPRRRGGQLTRRRAPMPVWNTYVAVDSADEASPGGRRGSSALMEPPDISDAGRLAVIADPEGAVVGAWQAGTTMGAHLVNEPGTWNFGAAQHARPEGAAAFYGVVFGWEWSGSTRSEGAFSMFRMPGYGDHLDGARSRPARRQAADGAPEGFEDTVAWRPPVGKGPEPESTPPHSSITFAVDDADGGRRAAGAPRRNGPHPALDAPWVRLDRLQDPQGAVFTASKYAPPSRPGRTA